MPVDAIQAWYASPPLLAPILLFTGRLELEETTGRSPGGRPMNNEWLYTIDACGETPMTRVSRSGRIEIARLMLMQEIDDTLREIANQSPIHRAAYWGYDDAIEELIADGADPNESDMNGETPLHKAVRLGNGPAIEVLVEHDADVNAASAYGLTPLHWAALTGQEEVAEYLLDKGADVRAREFILGGMTPLDFARIMHYRDVIDLLELHNAIF